MASARQLRVFLADDHVVMREALKAFLQQEGLEVVGEASDGRAAVHLCETLKPDIAVLDISMPLLNGIETARAITKTCPGTRVVLLTMHGEDSQVFASLRAGIKGFVLKSSAASSLLEAIDCVSKGEVFLSPPVSRTLVDAYVSHGEAPPDPLSSREREVLQLIAEGTSMRDIARLLGISIKTVETHRARLTSKLDIHDVAGLVRYAIRRGMITLES